MNVDDFGKVTVSKKDNPTKIQKFYEKELLRRDRQYEDRIYMARRDAVIRYAQKLYKITMKPGYDWGMVGDEITQELFEALKMEDTEYEQQSK